VDFRVEVTSLGLKWQSTGVAKPIKGRELTNLNLSNALENKLEFEQEEWTSFGVVGVQTDDFIKSRNSYFKPNSDGRKARVERRRKWREFSKDINSLLRFV